MSGLVGVIAGAIAYSLLEGRWRWLALVVGLAAALIAYEILNA